MKDKNELITFLDERIAMCKELQNNVKSKELIPESWYRTLECFTEIKGIVEQFNNAHAIGFRDGIVAERKQQASPGDSSKLDDLVEKICDTVQVFFPKAYHNPTHFPEDRDNLKKAIRKLLQDIMERQEKDIEYGGLIDALKVFIERGEELRVCEITDHLLMAIQALEWKKEQKQRPVDDLLVEKIMSIFLPPPIYVDKAVKKIDEAYNGRVKVALRKLLQGRNE